MAEYTEDVAEFVAVLLHSATVTHFQHLATNSYSQHRILGKYYQKIVDLADSYAEAYSGKYEQLKKFPDEFHVERDPVKYITNIKDFVEEARKELPEDTELQNIIDEIADLLNSTLFSLRFLE